MSSQWLLPHSARDANRYGLTILTVPAVCCVVVGIAQALQQGTLELWAPGAPTYNNAVVMGAVPAGLLSVVYLIRRYSQFYKSSVVLIVHLGFLTATTVGTISVGHISAQLLAYYLVPTLSVGYLWKPKIAYVLTTVTSATVLVITLWSLSPVVAWSVWSCASIVMYGTTLLLVTARKQELAALDSIAEVVATDQLTKLGSRAHFDDSLIEVTSLGTQAAVLVLLDVDRFKAINDNYGHLVGDQALQELAGHLGSQAEPSGNFFRLGGDEFGAIFPHATIAEVTQWAEQLHHRLATTPLADVGDSPVHLETSIGICPIEPGITTSKIAYSAADHAMYQAKRSTQPAIRLAKELPVNDSSGTEMVS